MGITPLGAPLRPERHAHTHTHTGDVRDIPTPDSGRMRLHSDQSERGSGHARRRRTASPRPLEHKAARHTGFSDICMYLYKQGRTIHRLSPRIMYNTYFYLYRCIIHLYYFPVRQRPPLAVLCIIRRICILDLYNTQRASGPCFCLAAATAAAVTASGAAPAAQVRCASALLGTPIVLNCNAAGHSLYYV